MTEETSGSSSDSSSEEETTPAETVKPQDRERNRGPTHDVSSSSDSSSEDEAPVNTNGMASAIKEESMSAKFSDTASESTDNMRPVIDNLLTTLASPQKKKRKLKDSPARVVDGNPSESLKTPRNATPKRKQSDIESSSEEESSQSPKKKNNFEKVTQLMVSDEPFKFECPAGFQEVSCESDSLWQEDVEGKEFWLIKAPLDFDPDILQGRDPGSMEGQLGRGQAKDDDSFIWKAKTVQNKHNQISDYAVLLPSEQNKNPTYAGAFHGELYITKGYESPTFTIPEVTKLPPQMPTGLKLRYTPFGSESSLGDGESEIFRPSETATPSSSKKKKKKKNKDEPMIHTDELDSSYMQMEVPTSVDNQVEQTSESLKKKKKNKKAKSNVEVKPESVPLDTPGAEVIKMEVDEVDSVSKKKKKKKNKSEKQDEMKVDINQQNVKVEIDETIDQSEDHSVELTHKKKKSKKDKKSKKERY